jgi:hypothetical protein
VFVRMILMPCSLNHFYNHPRNSLKTAITGRTSRVELLYIRIYVCTFKYMYI